MGEYRSQARIGRPLKRVRHAAVSLALLIVGACASTGPASPPDLKSPVLAGTRWTATMIGNDFAVGKRPTLQFRGDGRVAGNAGCTVYFGSAEISSAAVRFQSLQGDDESNRYTNTCDSLHLEQQARFLAALQAARQIRVVADRALLLDARHNVLVYLEQHEELRESRYDALADLEFVALTPEMGQYFGTVNGVLVTRARTPNAIELREGDVLLSINGRHPVNAPHALRILNGYPPGSTLDLQIVRQREPLDLKVTLTE